MPTLLPSTEAGSVAPDETPVVDLLQAGAFRIAGRRFLPDEYRVEVDGQAVTMEPKVLGVLVALAQTPGAVVTRQEIFDQVWPETCVEEGVLFRAVSELRRIFDDDPKVPEVIETIRGRGYRLKTDVTVEDRPDSGAWLRAEVLNRVPTLEPASADASPGGDGSPVGSGAWRWKGFPLRPLVGGTALLALVAAVFVLRSSDAGMQENVASTVPALPTPRTVLPGAEVQPTLSPDGSSVAYTWFSAQREPPRLEVWHAGESEPRALLDDGRGVVHPSWSPRGELAFWRFADDGFDLVVIPPMNGPPVVLLEGRRGVGSITWSPDASSLWTSFEDEGLIAVRHLQRELGTWTRISDPAAGRSHDADAAADSSATRLAFVRRLSSSYGEILVHDLPTRRTTQALGGAAVDGLAWLPDPPMLVFGGYFEGRSGLWALRDDAERGSGEASRWTEPRWLGLEDASEPAVSADGRTLAFTRGDYRADIGSLDLATREIRTVVRSSRKARHPALDPSGTMLAFSSNRDGGYSIWLADADGTGPRKIATGDDYASRPVWSPDGRSLAYEANDDGQLDVFVLDAPFGEMEPRRLAEHPAVDREPAWSPDGATVYFASTRSGPWQVWRVDALGGVAVPVERAFGRAPMVTRDGRWIVFHDAATRGLARIAVADADTGDRGTGPPELLTPGVPVREWALDDADVLHYVELDAGSIGRIDLRTGRPMEPLRLPLAETDRDLSFHGGRIVFTHVVSVEKDIYTIPTTELYRRLESGSS